MNGVRFEDSGVEPARGNGYKLSSCEPYWTVIGAFDDTPGYIWHWTGEGWTDTWRGMLLYDRDGALDAAGPLHAAGIVHGIVRAVNLADYVRFDRRMSGAPLHIAGRSRHRGSAEALAEVYQAMGTAGGEES